ncbi:hypothetical protein [Nocardioides sp. LHG3406-4]|uniref:hypothetical protein n=1 Tax=Nocardioides sp. LHG3406-4 TaxID=2804575 RepID=UPI003CF94948
MEKGTDLGPVPIAWWRFLLVGAMCVALYFGIRAVSTTHQTHPAFFVPAILLGGALDLLAGRREVAVLSWPKRTGHRGRRSRRAVSKSAARSYVAGLVGAGLILARSLSSSVMEWMMLGTVALVVGGAGHAWVMERHYEQAGGSLAE